MEQQNNLYLSGFGPLTANETYKWGPGIQGVYVIHYIKKGRGFFETGGKQYTINAGESFFISPEQTVKYYPDSTDPWEYCWVNFNGRSAKEIISLTAFPECPVCPKAQDLSSYYKEFSTDIKLWHAQLHNNGLLQLLLAEYIKIYPASTMELSTNYMHYAQQCVNANYHRQDFGVTELAQTVGIERSYLYRIFMESKGISPKQYIINIRMENAIQMMQRGITSIQLISYSVGYEDPQYFSNAFKKKFGLSPKNYIKLKFK